MDCMSNDDIRSVALKKSARVGYTKMIVAAIGYFAEHRKRNQCVWQPVDEDADDFVKDEIDPMLRDCEAVQKVFPYYNQRCKQNTLSKKCFRGSTLDIRGGKSPKNYRRMTKAVVILDELSAFDPNIGKEGSPRVLARMRLQGAAYPKEISGSTPKIAGSCQITLACDEADAKLVFKVPCPHCGFRQELKWGGPDAEFGIKWEGRDASTAMYLCAGPKCRKKFSYDEYIRDSMALGRWETEDGIWLDGDGRFRGARDALIDAPAKVAFHIWAAYSPQVSWRELVAEWFACGKDPDALQAFVNTTLGECWEEDKGERSTAEVLLQRREPYALDASGNGDVPNGVQAVVAGIDGQDDRIEIQFDGYGFGEERWTLDYVRLYGDLSRPEIWDRLERELRNRQFVRRDGTILQLSMVCMDSGGHYTDEVYAFSRRMGRRFVIPIKGASEHGQPIAKWPRKPNQHRVYLTMVGSDTAKSLIFQRYQITGTGPGVIHWPARQCFDTTYFEQLCAPERVKKWKKGVPYFTWDSKKRRDEASDCSVYSLAAIRLQQQHFGLRFAPYEEPGKAPAETDAADIPVAPRPANQPTTAPRRPSNYLRRN